MHKLLYFLIKIYENSFELFLYVLSIIINLSFLYILIILKTEIKFEKTHRNLSRDIP